MVNLKKNVIANYVGKGWELFSGFIFIPFYLRYLGMEAYALIGVFSILKSYFELFDFGMTPTLTRELARISPGARTPEAARELMRTFEWCLIIIAILLVCAIWLTSPWLTQHWFKSKSFSVEQLSFTLDLIGIAATIRIIECLYRGALLGLQYHVWLNTASLVISTLRSIGAILILIITPTITAFFIWQVVISLCSVFIFRYGAVSHLPTANTKKQFVWQALLDIKQYAVGLFVGNCLALVILQLDKILLSHFLTLEQFGYYAFAATIASTVAILVSPLADSYAPRLMQLVAMQDHMAISSTYHQAAQLMSIILAPIAFVVILFSEKLLLVWDAGSLLTQYNFSIIIILTLGGLLNGFTHIPYQLQLAYGWISLSLKSNAIISALLIPLLLVIVPQFGAIGAAYTWCGINTIYVLVNVQLMHRRLLPNEKWTWYRQDVFYPLVGAGLACVIMRILCPEFSNLWAASLWILVTTLCACISAIWCAPRIRCILKISGTQERRNTIKNKLRITKIPR